jgi:hypothetical protein
VTRRSTPPIAPPIDALDPAAILGKARRYAWHARTDGKAINAGALASKQIAQNDPIESTAKALAEWRRWEAKSVANDGPKGFHGVHAGAGATTSESVTRAAVTLGFHRGRGGSGSNGSVETSTRAAASCEPKTNDTFLMEN